MNRITSLIESLLMTIKMSLLFRLSIIPLGIHLILWWLFYGLMIVRKTAFAYDVSEVSLAYWSWLWLAAFLTAFINAIGTFKKDFGYQLLMSVSRRNFAIAYLKAAVLFNLFVTALILLDLNILRALNHAYGFLEIDFLSIVYGSQTEGVIQQISIIFSALIFITMWGAFIGSSTYRFGMFFIWGFWLTVGLGTAMLASLSEVFGFRGELIDSVNWFMGAVGEPKPVVGAVNFLLASAVLLAATFLNVRKLELK